MAAAVGLATTEEIAPVAVRGGGDARYLGGRMTPILWIVASGAAMTTLALLGGVMIVLPERWQRPVVSPLVAFAAGGLLGGACFHLLPEALEAMGVGAVAWAAVGFAAFAGLEALLTRWRGGEHQHHEGHVGDTHEAPIVWLLLVSDAVHKLLGGMSVAAAFVVDVRLGLTVWAAEAAHEIPHELGDMAVMLHMGTPPRKALLLNVAASLTFPLGGLLGALLSTRIEVPFLLAFAAGNFLYIAIVDLLPDLVRHGERRAVHAGALAIGLLGLLGLKLAMG